MGPRIYRASRGEPEGDHWASNAPCKLVHVSNTQGPAEAGFITLDGKTAENSPFCRPLFLVRTETTGQFDLCGKIVRDPYGCRITAVAKGPQELIQEPSHFGTLR